MCLPPTPGDKCVKSLGQCAGTVRRGRLLLHPHPPPLPSVFNPIHQLSHPPALQLCVLCQPGGASQSLHSFDHPNSGWRTQQRPWHQSRCPLLGWPSWPHFARNFEDPHQAWIQAGLPLLIAHPQLWRLQGFTSLESHSLEESREIDGCGGPDGDPWGSRLS